MRKLDQTIVAFFILGAIALIALPDHPLTAADQKTKAASAASGGDSGKLPATSADNTTKLTATVAVSSGRTLHLPDKPYEYAGRKLPAHFTAHLAQASDTTPDDNRLTDAGATLGRALFYDTRLSINDTVSCSSCHLQERSFADSRKLSVGFEGKQGDRNSMSLVNLRFARTGAFWDERGGSLEEQALMPIHSRLEMGRDPETLPDALKGDAYYPQLFAAAFGDSQITKERVAKALAQFVRSLVSSDSKYDEGIVQVKAIKDKFPNFSDAENLGKQVFLDHCAICHRPRGGQNAHFDLFRSLNNGLDADVKVADSGSGDITLDPNEVGLFKPSSLRNVALTAPYMHDGRFETLEEVVEYYSSGVQRHPLTSGFAFRMQLDAKEQAGLLAFLHTLTDEKFIHDPRYSNPWITPGAARVEASSSGPKSSQDVSSQKGEAGKRVVASDQPSSPANSLTVEQRAERLTAGIGLPSGETFPWLIALDTDHDGSLGKTEYLAVAKVLAQTEAAPRLPNTRSARGRAPRGAREERGEGEVETSEIPAEMVALADLDGDGVLDRAETQRYQSLSRFFELRDGGRLEVRLDGALRPYDFQTDQYWKARSAYRTAKQEMTRKLRALDKAFLAELEQMLDAKEYASLQEMVLAGRGATLARRRSSVKSDDELKALAERHFAAFDEDSSGQLDKTELQKLAKILDQLPGGFGQAPQPAVDMQQFVERILSFDADRDGRLAELELPERMSRIARLGDTNGDKFLSPDEVRGYVRSAGFVQLVDNGIYVGGGFGDAFQGVDLNKLGLSQEKLQALEAAMSKYGKAVNKLTRDTIENELATIGEIYLSQRKAKPE